MLNIMMLSVAHAECQNMQKDNEKLKWLQIIKGLYSLSFPFTYIGYLLTVVF